MRLWIVLCVLCISSHPLSLPPSLPLTLCVCVCVCVCTFPGLPSQASTLARGPVSKELNFSNIQEPSYTCARNGHWVVRMGTETAEWNMHGNQIMEWKVEIGAVQLRTAIRMVEWGQWNIGMGNENLTCVETLAIWVRLSPCVQSVGTRAFGIIYTGNKGM